ncbi:hypothetical protein JCM10049v2_004917 [Rhodotorula toruloides]
MRDGAKLYCDIYRPADSDEKIPCLIMWSPYGKRYSSINMLPVTTWRCGIRSSDLSGWEKFEGLDPATWCPRGYAIASIDTRGAGNSDGSVQIMGQNMGEDGYDVVELLAKKDWCNGNVGMAGNSFRAISQWHIAAQQPPSLKAIAPWEGCGDLFREQFVRGGVFEISNVDLINKLIIKGNNGTEDFFEMYEREPLQSPYWADKRADMTKIKIPAYFSEKIHPWLEDFGLGYKRDDPSTIKEECLPIIHQKGLLQAYGFPHESFTWGVRSEPGVIGVFEKLFNTEDLLASFDAVNVSLPNRRDLPPVKPWAHQDQDPLRPGFRCIQGFVNLNPCGDNDGGLMVLKGGHLISKEYHETFKNEEQEFRWTNEMYLFTDTGLKWLEEKGLDLLGSQRKERGVPALST